MMYQNSFEGRSFFHQLSQETSTEFAFPFYPYEDPNAEEAAQEEAGDRAEGQTASDSSFVEWRKNFETSGCFGSDSEPEDAGDNQDMTEFFDARTLDDPEDDDDDEILYGIMFS
jgi:hypothetical protein